MRAGAAVSASTAGAWARIACLRTSPSRSGKQSLEADHARRGGAELAVFLEGRVRRVIGGDGVDGAVGERLAQRGDVFVARAAAG